MKNDVMNIELDKLREGIFLAIRGGGVRSSSSIGVIKALEEANIPIKGISGESGSSLVAGLYSCGYSAKEILDLFLKYNETITKAAKVYGGKGAIVIEEAINDVTNGILMKDLIVDCYINACQGSLINPKLYLFSKETTPEETLGFACSSSAGLPVFYGNSYKYIEGKKIALFDGGLLYNPYIPEDVKYPIFYSSFRNSINYQKAIPLLQKPVDVVNEMADVIVNIPVGKYIVTAGSNVIENFVETGYNQTRKLLNRK